MFQDLRKFTRAVRHCAEARADLLTAEAAEARNRAAGAILANAHHAIVLFREVRQAFAEAQGPVPVPPRDWVMTPAEPVNLDFFKDLSRSLRVRSPIERPEVREVAILDLGDDLSAEIGEKRSPEDLLPGARPRLLPSSWLARVARAALLELATRTAPAEVGGRADLRALHELAKISDVLIAWRARHPLEPVHASAKAAEASEQFRAALGLCTSPACSDTGGCA